MIAMAVKGKRFTQKETKKKRLSDFFEKLFYINSVIGAGANPF
jgi:hypothetical protein